MKTDTKPMARLEGGAPGRAIEISHLTGEKSREQGSTGLLQIRARRWSPCTGKVANPRPWQSARHPVPQPFVQPIQIEVKLGEAFRLGLRRESADPISSTGRTLDSH
jgi:hypothetical protein